MDSSQFRGQAYGWLIVFYVIIPLIFLLPILAFIAWKYDKPKLKKVVKIIGIPFLFLGLSSMLSNTIYIVKSGFFNPFFVSDIFDAISSLCKLIMIPLFGIISYKYYKKQDINKALIVAIFLFFILYFVFNRLSFYGIFDAPLY